MKLFKWIFRLVLILITLVIILAGVSVFLVYDNKDTTEDIYANYNKSTNHEVSALIFKALDDTKNTSEIDITFEESSLNFFLATIKNTVNESLGNKIKVKNIHTTFNSDGSKSIAIFFSAFGFPSSFKGDLIISENTTSIILQVNKASVGKISANNKQIGTILTYFVKSEDLNSTLQNKGIIVDLDMNQLKVTLLKENLQKMLSELFVEDDNKDLYEALIDILFTQGDLLNFCLDDPSRFGLALNLAQLAYNEEDYYKIPYSFAYDDVSEKCVTLLMNNIITVVDVAKVFDYLVRGYDAVSQKEEYDFIPSLNLESIGITNNRTYAGILNYETKEMKDVLLAQLPTIDNLTDPAFNFKIYQSDLDNILFKTGVVGTSYAFVEEVEDSNSIKSYDINYFYIEAIYTNITNDNMDLIFVINLNGKQIALKCQLHSNETSGLSMATTISKITFGKITLNEKQTKAIIEYLNIVTKDEEWFKVDTETQIISLDFSQLFLTTPELQTLLTSSTSSVTKFVRQTSLLNDEAYINLAFEVTLPFAK